jgi:hypothetical protein
MVKNTWMLFSMGAMIVGCNVAESAKSTPGVNLPDTGVTGSDAGDGAAPIACARGVSVVSSDYQSTNVSVVSPEGKVLSESIISSGSAPSGLTTPLSGDVIVPGARPMSGKLVTIDRTSAVLTWVDVASGSVEKQQSVGTGFAANPHDYLEVSGEKAYVTRYETNSAPGKEPFDDGGDVVVLNLSSSSITANIPLAKPDDGEFLPRPSRMLLSGHTVWVMLERLDAAFAPAGSSRIAGIDTATDSVSWTLDLQDAGNCGGMAQSPSSKVIVVSCSGGFDADAKGRALVLVDATVDPPKELRRFSTASVLDAPLAPSLAFATEKLLLGVAYGDTTATRNDWLYSVNVDSGEVTRVTDAGAAFALGDVLCSPGCSDLCFLADAELKPSGASTKGALRVYDASGKELPDKSFAVDPSIGLPPRSLGAL